jgi:hypothetical protein
MANSNQSEGEATLYVGPVLLVNNTNGKLEHVSFGSITPGLSSGNARSMLTSLAEVQKLWAEKTELTTDASSPDDDN